MVHALRLEGIKSMDWTASFHLLRLSSSSFCNKAEAVLLDSGSSGADVKLFVEAFTLFIPAWGVVASTFTWDSFFSRREHSSAKLLVCLINLS